MKRTRIVLFLALSLVGFRAAAEEYPLGTLEWNKLAAPIEFPLNSSQKKSPNFQD